MAQEFNDQMKGVIQSLLANDLEKYNTNEKFILNDFGGSWAIGLFRSAIQLPGVNQSPTIEFAQLNSACFKCTIKLSKHPRRIVFLQIFQDNYDRDLLPKRFNALASAIENVIPSWSKSAYTHGTSPVHHLRNECRNGSTVISINLHGSELQVEISG